MRRVSDVPCLVLEEIVMKATALVAGLLIISFAGTALADEYYIVKKPDEKTCTVVTTKPTEKETITQIGPLAFKTRQEAENRIKTVKSCDEATGSGDGDHD